MTTSEIASIGDLSLTSGETLPGVEVAYVTYGKLAPDKRNVILLTHGYTSSHRMADGPSSEGNWAGLVGPDLAIDTNRWFVVSSNMLGSAFGSTAPRTHNPQTGRAYGPDFPSISVVDIVAAQRKMLTGMGIDGLAAVVGPSYGGFQAFVWAIHYPDAVGAIVPVVTGLKSPATLDIDALEARFATHPNWNGGHYYEAGGVDSTMMEIRRETLINYGVEVELAETFGNDMPARTAALEDMVRTWAAAFDAHSLLTLGHASNAYDATPHLNRIRAKVLYVLSRTDKLFPPSLEPEVMGALKAAGIDARYCLLDSEHGHQASGRDDAKWAPALRTFLDGL
jgi:homoserine O-acetyltransferase/O-succinyltransferase